MQTKRENGQDFPAEAYLFVPDPTKPSTWKLRIWDATKKPTRAQLGAAAAALGPGGFRGQPVSLPPGEKDKVLGKLRGLYAQLGVKPDEMPAQVRASLSEAGLADTEIEGCLAALHALIETTGGSAVGMTEEEARQLTETREALKTLREELTEHKTARERAETEAKAASERVVGLERAATRRTLSEFVRANRFAFQGEVDGCVDQLEKYQTKLGEDFQGYLDERKAFHERMAASELFTQKSYSGPTPTGPMDAFSQAVKKAMSEGKLSEAEATARIAAEQPKLYAEYDVAFKQQIRRGGA